jgi:ribosomal protein S27E
VVKQVPGHTYYGVRCRHCGSTIADYETVDSGSEIIHPNTPRTLTCEVCGKQEAYQGANLFRFRFEGHSRPGSPKPA